MSLSFTINWSKELTDYSNATSGLSATTKKFIIENILCRLRWLMYHEKYNFCYDSELYFLIQVSIVLKGIDISYLRFKHLTQNIQNKYL
jgi:hypothetical protein